MSKPLIQVSNLKVIYNEGKSNEVRSLDNVSTSIYSQEYVIIYGPSGCGKSTLLYSISGLQKPTAGDVYLEGKKLAYMKKDELVKLHQSKMGMVFQAFYLISSLDVLDNVCLPKVFCGEPRAKRREHGIRLLQRFGIVEQTSKFPSQLSGGQKQRVSIARALVNDPEIILADEPVGNLDSASSENVLQILKDLNQIDKKTVILVTHNPEHLHFADRVIHMKDGKILREEVLTDKQRPEYVYVDKSEVGINPDKLSPDLKLLARTFKNLSPQQIGSLLVPFKANQLLSYITSDMMEEQLTVAGAYLKEFLFGNIELDDFAKKLDLDYKKGGAGWNRTRAEKFSKRVSDLAECVKVLGENRPNGEKIDFLANYLIEQFKLNLKEDSLFFFKSFLGKRIGNEIDRLELEKNFDLPMSRGGVGMYSRTAEKVSREVEMVMLLRYTV